LFADVIGSTSLGEQLDAERLGSLLSEYFAAVSAVVGTWGGTVEKFVGDAVMAVFGVPVVREDDPERAIRAALGILSSLEDLNQGFKERHGVTLRVRIGINTGEVIAPTSGPTADLIVAGDAVNVAARLEQAAEPGSVLAGDRTYIGARHAFRFAGPISLDLRGKSDVVRAWRVEESLPESTRGVPGLQTAMVGRDRELAALLALLQEAVATGQPRMVVIAGPAGMGKSRLVQEFLQSATTGDPDISVLRGRCLAAGHGITFWALAEILRTATGINLADPAEVAEEKVRTGLSELLRPLGLSHDEADQTVFALAFTAGIRLPGSPLETMEPRAVAAELSRAWPRLATACAASATTVVVVEDLHWAEQQLLDMLERLLARSLGPLLLVVTARPEFAEGHPGFAAGREETSTVSLRALTAPQSEQLLDGLLAVAELPTSLRDEILAKAEGNPFFVEEIIRRLLDEGAMVREGERWRATPIAGNVRVPDTVHALLASRIDALPREEKRILQEAAVVGRIFWEDPVSRAAGDGPAGDLLLRLEHRGLVFARPTSSIAGQAEFAFKHALVRDVAYSSLPKTRRAHAHAEYARWVEDLAGDRIDEFAELVAHHYYTAVAGEEADLAWAGDPDRDRVRQRAFDSLLRAGTVARQRFAISKAVDLHRQAFEVSPGDLERALALEAEGDDHFVDYHGDEAVVGFQGALEILRGLPEHGDDRARAAAKAARMICERSGTFRTQPPASLAEDLLSEGLAAVRDRKWRAWLLALSGALGMYWDAFGGGDPIAREQRIRMANEGLAIAQREGYEELLPVAARTVSELYVSVGAYGDAVDASRKQLAVVDGIESPGEQALILFELSQTMTELASKFEEGLALARRCHAVATTLSAHELMHATFTEMEALYWLGRWEDIPPLLEEHLGVYEQEADVMCYAVRGGPLVGALIEAHRGHRDRARELAERARGRPDRRRLLLECSYAEVLALIGDTTGALAVLEHAYKEPSYGTAFVYWYRPVLATIEVLLAAGDYERLEKVRLPDARRFASIPFARAVCERAEGIVAQWADPTRARTLLGGAAAAFGDLGVPFEAARTREALAGLEGPLEGASLLRQALETYEALRAEPYGRRVREALATHP
jgi:class 3 adenylate cyclase